MNQFNEALEQVVWLQQTVLDMSQEVLNPVDDQFMIEFYHHFYACLDKQENLWSRLRLMGDPELLGLEIAIEEFCDMFGKTPSQSIPDFHHRVKLEILAELSDLTGEEIGPDTEITVDFEWKD